MRYAAISRVYASALLELAVDRGELDALSADLASLRELLAARTGFQRVLESPELGFDQKRRVLERVLAQSACPLTLRFLLLLVRKHREAVLPAVLEMFGHLCDERAGRLRGRLQSARALGGDEIAGFEQALSRATGREVLLTVEADGTLLAGMVLQLAGETVDGSLRTRLNRLRENLLTAPMEKG